MNRFWLTILSCLSFISMMAQSSADKLLQNTLAQLDKDGEIAMSLHANMRLENSTNNMDILLKLSHGCLYFQTDDTTIWYDGKTLWRGIDFGAGHIEEIYITEPTAQEKELYDITALLRNHQGYKLSSTENNSFTFTSSGSEQNSMGIDKVTFQVHPNTHVIQEIVIAFHPESGIISAHAQITDYKPKQKFDKKTFTCPIKEFDDAEIIDLR